MGMLKLTRTERRGLLLLALSLLLIWSAAWILSGCNDARWLMREHSSSERTVTKRDTIIWAPADSALVKLVTDVRSMRALIDELKAQGPRTVRGTNNAKLIMSVVHDTLLLEARCDSLAQVLEGALVTIHERDSIVTHLERTIATKDKSEKGTMPGWMKGTIWMIVVAVLACVVLCVLFLLIKKHLFTRL